MVYIVTQETVNFTAHIARYTLAFAQYSVNIAIPVGMRLCWSAGTKIQRIGPHSHS